MTLRVGILGGTFDPIHNAHLAIAQAALERLGLGSILWIPTGAPGYRAPPVARAIDRVAMLKLALAAEPRYVIDERELLPDASGFAFDSIASLKSENPGSRFLLIMGADQYERRASWHRWADIEKICDIAVAARPGSKLDGRAKAMPMTAMDISASGLRARIARGEDVSGMVPASVLGYIREKGLYR